MKESQSFFDTVKNYSSEKVRAGLAIGAMSGMLFLTGCGESDDAPRPAPNITPTAEQVPLAPTTVPDEDMIICPQTDNEHPECLNNPN